jgi:hypothetical protein
LSLFGMLGLPCVVLLLDIECLLFSEAASHRMSQGRATQIIELSGICEHHG